MTKAPSTPRNLYNRQDKGNTSQTKPEVYPKFDDLEDPNTILGHIDQLKNKNEAPPHSGILQQLSDQLEPLDFKLLVNPPVEKLRRDLDQLPPPPEYGTKREEIRKQIEKIKIGEKHYRILSIENISKTAADERWGLCKNHDFIFLYNGTFWSEIDKDEFQMFLGEAAERMGVPWDKARDYQFRDKLFKQFLSTEYLRRPPGDNNTVLINLLNGTFEINPQGTKLRPFDSSDFLTYQLPFKHDPQAKAPLFEAYLNKVLPDKERQRVLAEYLGFVFIKHGSNALKEEKALILYGTGSNGKSVFYEVVNALLGGENVSSYSLQSLTNDNGYFRAKLANKLVNYSSEINGKLEASTFKQMVSGEPVEARLPYGQPFILKQYAKMIFNVNELPKDVEHTNAYFRRFLIIPFDVTIPEEEQDKNLHRKIIDEELSGVFNWVLDGLYRLLEQKSFSECEAAQQAVNQYKVESDSVQMFIVEYDYEVSITNETPLKNLYSEYRDYCIASGFKSCSLRTFADRFRNAGYQTERKTHGTVVNVEKKSFV